MIIHGELEGEEMTREEAEKELRAEGFGDGDEQLEMTVFKNLIDERLARRQAEAERDALKREGRESAALMAQHTAAIIAERDGLRVSLDKAYIDQIANTREVGMQVESLIRERDALKQKVWELRTCIESNLELLKEQQERRIKAEAERDQLKRDNDALQELLTYRTHERNESRELCETAQRNGDRLQEAMWVLEKERDALKAKLSELEGMKVHPDNACSGCRKTFAENYGQDFLCAECKARYRKELDALKVEQEKLIWNLGGISTIACSRTPMAYDREWARAALDDVNKLVVDYDALKERVRRLYGLCELRGEAGGDGMDEEVQQTINRIRSEALEEAAKAVLEWKDIPVCGKEYAYESFCDRARGHDGSCNTRFSVYETIADFIRTLKEKK